MAARSIASLSFTFGLVSIPVKVYVATEGSAAIKFKLLAPGGAARLRQQYVTDEPLLPSTAMVGHHDDVEPETEKVPKPMPERVASPGGSSSALSVEPRLQSVAGPEHDSEDAGNPSTRVVERAEMVKGYEFEQGRFVYFTPAELKTLEAQSRQTIDIVRFIPATSIDPVYYDKAYFLAPDKRAAKPYSLLMRAMQETGRCALAKWAWRAKEYVVHIRPTPSGLVLQQLLYADEVRSQQDLHVELAPVSPAELQLATQFIEQLSAEGYDPAEFVDEEKQRILAAVERKIAGRESVASALDEAPTGGQVVDLMAALRASLAAVQEPKRQKPASRTTPGSSAARTLEERKPPRRATRAEPAPAAMSRKQ